LNKEQNQINQNTTLRTTPKSTENKSRSLLIKSHQMSAFPNGTKFVKRSWVPDRCTLCRIENCMCFDEREEDRYYESLGVTDSKQKRSHGKTQKTSQYSARPAPQQTYQRANQRVIERVTQRTQHDTPQSTVHRTTHVDTHSTEQRREQTENIDNEPSTFDRILSFWKRFKDVFFGFFSWIAFLLLSGLRRVRNLFRFVVGHRPNQNPNAQGGNDRVVNGVDNLRGLRWFAQNIARIFIIP
ncbi:hypothetical protein YASMINEVIRUS_1301, partial [Yasminevirus sp. GU-2018]